MRRLWPIIGLVWFVLATAAPAAAETIVNFPSLDGTTDLIGHLDRREDDMGFGAWLGMPETADAPFILVVAQFFEGTDPFADAPNAVLAPFAHFGIELPAKTDVDTVAEKGEEAGLDKAFGPDYVRHGAKG